MAILLMMHVESLERVIHCLHASRGPLYDFTSCSICEVLSSQTR